MRGLVPRIHAFLRGKDVDGRDRPGHDERMSHRGCGRHIGGLASRQPRQTRTISREDVMTMRSMSRRHFVGAGAGLTIANFLPGTAPLALAATMEEQTIAAAKKAGAAQVNGMIWSPYFVPMQPVIAEFTKETGIGVGGVQDISIFD